MKTIIAILFLCSVAGSQVTTVQQSSEHSIAWAQETLNAPTLSIICQSDPKHFMRVTSCEFQKGATPQDAINWMIAQNLVRDTCGSKGIQWILDKDGAILYGRRTPECPIKKTRKAGARISDKTSEAKR